MVKIYLDPADLHNRFWGTLPSTIYGPCLRIADSDKEKITVQLIYTALESIFLSMETVPNSNFEDYLAPFVDQVMLTDILAAQGLIEFPERMVVTRQYVEETSLLGPMPVRRCQEEVISRLPCATLAMIAYDDLYQSFREYLETTIESALRQSRYHLNPYSIVTVTPRTGRGGRIVSLELSLGEDIRIVYYRQKFPSGRYRPDDNGPVHSIEGIPSDSE